MHLKFCGRALTGTAGIGENVEGMGKGKGRKGGTVTGKKQRERGRRKRA